MRPRSLICVALLVASAGTRLLAQSGDAMADGLTAGSYVRIAAGRVTPINPSGGFKDWKSGVGANVMFENWDNGRGGASMIGFAFYLDYSLLPFDDKQFSTEYDPRLNGPLQSASAKRA